MGIFQKRRPARVTGCICGFASHRAMPPRVFSPHSPDTLVFFRNPSSVGGWDSFSRCIREVFARTPLAQFPFIHLDSRETTKEDLPAYPYTFSPRDGSRGRIADTWDITLSSVSYEEARGPAYQSLTTEILFYLAETLECTLVRPLARVKRFCCKKEVDELRSLLKSEYPSSWWNFICFRWKRRSYF